MKTIAKIMCLFTVCFILFSCNDLQNSNKELNHSNDIPSSQSQLSDIVLTAQENGILITIIKDEKTTYKNLYIQNVENEIETSVYNLTWTNNKIEILYPFSEKGNISKFNIWINGSKKQTVEIMAIGGIGYPVTGLFEQIKMKPSYDPAYDSFSVTITSDAQAIDDFYITTVNENNKFNKNISIQFWLGDPKNGSTFGISGISLNNMVSGCYYHNINFYVPPYSEYNNKFCTQPIFNLEYNGILWHRYAKNISEICMINENPERDCSQAKNISLTAQDDGILITLKKDENTSSANFYIQNIETGIKTIANNLTWTDNKIELHYPFSKSGEISKFSLWINNAEKQEVEILATGGIGYPVTELIEQINMEPSYDPTDDTFGVKVTTDATSISDFFIDAVNTNNDFNPKVIAIQFWLGTPNTGATWGFSSVVIGNSSGVSGFYKHIFNGFLPDYTEYDNKCCTQAWFDLWYKGISWSNYANSISEPCIISNQ
ncbi:MAG: hypothetical protein J6X78_07910 [Treponema sp.]|nr:hypothetical protein [Treponema sp.]